MNQPGMKFRLWPDTLFGRLALILVIGMFGGQLLTSTIWFETHDHRTLEIPSRVFASRLADTLRLMQDAPDNTAREALARQLGDDHYSLRWIDKPGVAPAPSVAQRTVEDLLQDVLAQR
jgi:hypothetical protein